MKHSSFSHYSVALCIAKATTSKEADLFRDQLLIFRTYSVHVLESESLCAHSLLYYKQNACADHQDRTDDVEDRGTDTTGGRKE